MVFEHETARKALFASDPNFPARRPTLLVDQIIGV
jgi:hypothetical protein